MAFDFQKLADVEAVEEFPEGAKVLIEHEGDIKRCAADGLGGGSGSIPVLLATEDPETEEYTFKLEDGRTADEFAASFEKNGITPAIFIAEPVEAPVDGMIMKQYIHAPLYMEERITEGAPSEYASLVGGCAYMYSDKYVEAMLTNIDMEEMVLLDHYIWALGG